MPTDAKPDPRSQAEKFADLARELECDESEDDEAFKAKVVKVARAPRSERKSEPPESGRS